MSDRSYLDIKPDKEKLPNRNGCRSLCVPFRILSYCYYRKDGAASVLNDEIVRSLMEIGLLYAWNASTILTLIKSLLQIAL